MRSNNPWATSAIATLLVLVGTGTSAYAEPVAPPSLVDDGSYPGAADILAQQNVLLVGGDGHILLADCATPPVSGVGVLKVYTTDETIGADGIGRVCFKVTGDSGWLSLRVPGVYEIRGDGQSSGTGHAGTAQLTNDEGEEISVPLDPDGSVQVGQGADPNALPTMLLELRVGSGLAPVTGAQAAVGKLNIVDRMCTVALVAPYWVLAGKSCLPYAEGAPPEAALVAFPGRAVRSIDLLKPHAERDLVLARLTSAVTDVTPLLAADSAPTATALTTIGYGRGATEWINDGQRSTEITFATSDSLTLSAPSGPLVCKGMAGAPALYGGKIAGVLDQAGQAGCFDTNGSDSSVRAVRADGIGTWIASTIEPTDHNWPLTDIPAGATTGTPVTSTVDNAVGGAALPLSASPGVTWKVGDTRSPVIELDGVGGSLTTTARAVSTDDWEVSLWVKLDAYGGTVLSQDGPRADAPSFRLVTDYYYHSWKVVTLQGFLKFPNQPIWNSVESAPEAAQLGVWTRITVQFQTSRKMIFLKINDVPAASDYVRAVILGQGPLRIGTHRTGTSTFGTYLDGAVSDVKTRRTATLPAGPLSNCNGLVRVYGFTSDGKLTYTLIEPLTGTVAKRLTSTTSLGFTPKAVAALSTGQLLVLSSTGSLYHIAVAQDQLNEISFNTPTPIATTRAISHMAYDGSRLYVITDADEMFRYQYSYMNGLSAETLIGAGFNVETLTATHAGRLLGTTADGTIRDYAISGDTATATTLGSWAGTNAVVSPFGGLLFTRVGQTLTMRFDADWLDGSGTDITTYGTVADPAGWTQAVLSAVPQICRAPSDALLG